MIVKIRINGVAGRKGNLKLDVSIYYHKPQEIYIHLV